MKICVGGHACNSIADADCYLHDYEESRVPVSIIAGSDIEGIRAILEDRVEDESVEIVSSLQGLYSLQVVPVILTWCREKGKECSVKILAIPENIRATLPGCPKITLG